MDQPSVLTTRSLRPRVAAGREAGPPSSAPASRSLGGLGGRAGAAAAPVSPPTKNVAVPEARRSADLPPLPPPSSESGVHRRGAKPQLQLTTTKERLRGQRRRAVECAASRPTAARRPRRPLRRDLNGARRVTARGADLMRNAHRFADLQHARRRALLAALTRVDRRVRQALVQGVPAITPLGAHRAPALLSVASPVRGGRRLALAALVLALSRNRARAAHAPGRPQPAPEAERASCGAKPPARSDSHGRVVLGAAHALDRAGPAARMRRRRLQRGEQRRAVGQQRGALAVAALRLLQVQVEAARQMLVGRSLRLTAPQQQQVQALLQHGHLRTGWRGAQVRGDGQRRLPARRSVP